MPKGMVVMLPGDAPLAVRPSSARAARGSRWGRLAGKWATLFNRNYLLLNLIALLLGRVSIMGEMAPFGLAFFAAVAQVNRGLAPAAAVWAVFGVLSIGRYLEAGLYIFAAWLYFRLVDKLARPERKLQAVPLYVFAIVALGGTSLALWQPDSQYHVLTAVFEAAIAAVLAYIFTPGLALLATGAEERSFTGEAQMCLVVLLAAAVAGLGGISLAGYSVRDVIGSLVIMTLALAGGTGIGAAVGVAVGLVTGLSDGNPSTVISVYAIAGLMAGTFRALGKFAVILGFLLGSAIGVLYLGQTAELLKTLAEASIGAAALVVIPVARLRQWSRGLREGATERTGPDHSVQAAIQKLIGIAELFGSLAANIGQDSTDARAKLREEDTARLLAAVGERVCGPCSRRAACWEQNFYRTYQGMIDGLALAENNPDNRTSPRVLVDGCIRDRELSEAICQVAQQNRSRSFWQKKLADTRQVVAEQAKALGLVLHNLARELQKPSAGDTDLAVSLREKAAFVGCPLGSVQIQIHKGVPRITAEKRPCEGGQECRNSILPLVSTLLRERFSLHNQCGNAAAGQPCKLNLQAAGRYGVQTGSASLAKNGVSGDTCTVVPVQDGKIALILSDGMGSGSQAAGESSTAVKFLTRLLSAGFALDVAVQTLNSLLLLKMPNESFATIDMAVVDTRAGEAEFLKVGSAPSFLKRVREVSTIRTASLPAGILQQIEIEPVKWVLAPGDILVLVSDGIAEAPSRGAEKEVWVANFLRRLPSEDPQEIADKLLQQAREMGGADLRDDMTVLVAKIIDRPGLER
ncbi:MAG TPA: stage II sporulation protein E [Selenomonadales bacterium]|nr:stage II sporulation protein E [Selenomonadales bacterium]